MSRTDFETSFIAGGLGRGTVSTPYFQVRMLVEDSLLVCRHLVQRHARTLNEWPHLANPRIPQRSTNFP